MLALFMVTMVLHVMILILVTCGSLPMFFLDYSILVKLSMVLYIDYNSSREKDHIDLEWHVDG